VRHLHTSLGLLDEDAARIILAHEHVFVDLRRPDHPAHAQAPTAEVVEVMTPGLQMARAAGIGAIVEASTLGVGRRADILSAVSRASGMPLLVPTGVYREPWIPAWVHDASEEKLHQWMRGELTGEIEGTGLRAGWIKLSAGDEGLTACETKVLRAAGRAAAETGAVIGSHTIKGRVVQDQLGILEEIGLPADRFIWIHTQAETDRGLHVEIGRRGAWLEYDAIGSADPDAMYVSLVEKALGADLGAKVLLSQDRGWYDPSKARGGEQKPYTYLVEVFLPKLAAAGIGQDMIRRLTRSNPFAAFSRPLISPRE
jgi:phosphotriesterase-related protein